MIKKIKKKFKYRQLSLRNLMKTKDIRIKILMMILKLQNKNNTKYNNTYK